MATNEVWYRGRADPQARLARTQDAEDARAQLLPSVSVAVLIQQLAILLELLQYELLCLRFDEGRQHAQYTEDGNEALPWAVLDHQWTASLVETLSDPLISFITPQTFPALELQMRTAMCALQVLYAQYAQYAQHDQRARVNHDYFESFRRKLAYRFRDLMPVTFQRADPTMERHASCLYFLSVMEEFFKNFQPERNSLVTVLVQGVRFLSVALTMASPAWGGNIELNNALRQVNSGIRYFYRSPLDHFQKAFSLQELTHYALALHRYSTCPNVSGRRSRHIEAARNCSSRLASQVYGEILKSLQEISRDRVKVPTRIYDNILATICHGPPSVDLYHFIYNAIDCAVLLSSHISFTDPCEAQKLKRLNLLLRSFAADTRLPPPIRWKAHAYLYNVTHDATRSDGALCRFYTSEQECEHMSQASIIIDKARVLNPAAWVEAPSPIVSLDGDVTVQRVARPREGNFAALSPDCTKAIFYGYHYLQVFNIASHHDQSQEIFHISNKGTPVHAAITNKHFVALFNDKESHYYQIHMTFFYCADPEERRFASHRFNRNQILKQVAICDDPEEDKFYVAVVGSGETSMSSGSNPRLTLLEVDCALLSRRLPNAFSPSPADRRLNEHLDRYAPNDPIKFVDFSKDNSQLVCVTNANRVIVWSFATKRSLAAKPYITAQEFQNGPQVQGITSANVFQSPSDNPYVFCTTWYSNSRSKSRGEEWPFISPAPAGSADIPPDYINMLDEVLSGADVLIAGSVSPSGAILSMREKSGRIFIVPLEPNEQSLHGLRASTAISLGKSLSHQSGALPSSMRFLESPKGVLFYALDSNGKLYIKSLPYKYMDTPTSRGSGTDTPSDEYSANNATYISSPDPFEAGAFSRARSQSYDITYSAAADQHNGESSRRFSLVERFRRSNG